MSASVTAVVGRTSRDGRRRGVIVDGSSTSVDGSEAVRVVRVRGDGRLLGGERYATAVRWAGNRSSTLRVAAH